MVLKVGQLLHVKCDGTFFYRGDIVEVTELKQLGTSTFVRLDHPKRKDYLVYPLDLVEKMIERKDYQLTDVSRGI